MPVTIFAARIHACEERVVFCVVYLPVDASGTLCPSAYFW